MQTSYLNGRVMDLFIERVGRAVETTEITPIDI
jgi:hypothetical protein